MGWAGAALEVALSRSLFDIFLLYSSLSLWMIQVFFGYFWGVFQVPFKSYLGGVALRLDFVAYNTALEIWT